MKINPISNGKYITSVYKSNKAITFCSSKNGSKGIFKTAKDFFINLNPKKKIMEQSDTIRQEAESKIKQAELISNKAKTIYQNARKKITDTIENANSFEAESRVKAQEALEEADKIQREIMDLYNEGAKNQFENFLIGEKQIQFIDAVPEEENQTPFVMEEYDLNGNLLRQTAFFEIDTDEGVMVFPLLIEDYETKNRYKFMPSANSKNELMAFQNCVEGSFTTGSVMNQMIFSNGQLVCYSKGLNMNDDGSTTIDKMLVLDKGKVHSYIENYWLASDESSSKNGILLEYKNEKPADYSENCQDTSSDCSYADFQITLDGKDMTCNFGLYKDENGDERIKKTLFFEKGNLKLCQKDNFYGSNGDFKTSEAISFKDGKISRYNQSYNKSTDDVEKIGKVFVYYDGLISQCQHDCVYDKKGTYTASDTFFFDENREPKMYICNYSKTFFGKSTCEKQILLSR